MMEPTKIKTCKQANEALEEIERLLAKAEAFKVLVEDHLNNCAVSGKYDPIDIIILKMKQLNMKQRDLVPYIGQKSHTSEVLARKRKLSLGMIQALVKLGIPAKVLIQDYTLSAQPKRGGV